MRTSENVSEIFAALSLAQNAMAEPKRTKQGYGYKYAPMEEILRVAKPELEAQELGIIQSPISKENGEIGVLTRIVHGSGQWVESEYSMALTKEDPQAVGSLITYFRRYAVMAFLNIAPEDDDGEGAMPSNPQTKQAPKTYPPKNDINQTQQNNKSPATAKQKNVVEILIKKNGLGNEISDEWFDNMTVSQASEFIVKYGGK